MDEVTVKKQFHHKRRLSALDVMRIADLGASLNYV